MLLLLLLRLLLGLLLGLVVAVGTCEGSTVGRTVAHAGAALKTGSRRRRVGVMGGGATRTIRCAVETVLRVIGRETDD